MGMCAGLRAVGMGEGSDKYDTKIWISAVPVYSPQFCDCTHNYGMYILFILCHKNLVTSF